MNKRVEKTRVTITQCKEEVTCFTIFYLNKRVKFLSLASDHLLDLTVFI